MNFHDWLSKKIKDKNTYEVAKMLNCDTSHVLHIKNTMFILDPKDIIRLWVGFKLTQEELLELISILAETFNQKPNEIFISVLNEVVLMAENNNGMRLERKNN